MANGTGLTAHKGLRNLLIYTVEPRFNELLDITNDVLCPDQSYSKKYGIEPRYNEHNPEAQT